MRTMNCVLFALAALVLLALAGCATPAPVPMKAEQALAVHVPSCLLLCVVNSRMSQDGHSGDTDAHRVEIEDGDHVELPPEIAPAGSRRSGIGSNSSPSRKALRRILGGAK